ncbi:substrate-binding periplasmic protein [Formivibrio citricus]|nr:ABC transporter substrate-binding protein [Formivibrio citricus]
MPDLFAGRKVWMLVGILLRRATGCVGAGLVFGLGSAMVFADPVKLRTFSQEAFFAKYNLTNPQRPGICIEIIRALEKLDPELKIVGLETKASTARIEAALAAGKIDVFFGLIKTKERAAHFVVAGDPLFNTAQLLVARKNDPIEVKDWDDVRKLGKDGVILVNEGTGQAFYLKKQGGLLIDDQGLTGLVNLKKLIMGRGRLFYVSDMYVAEDLALNKDLASSVKMLSPRFQKEGIYTMFSRKTPPELVNRIVENLKKLERSGEMKRIRARYFLG